MTISIYDLSIPVLTRGLDNLSAILGKAAAHAEQRKWDSGVVAATRLFPDMLPLSKQVQIACDMAKGAAARLAGREVPAHEDTERSLADLQQRIAKALAVVRSVAPSDLQGAEGRAIVLQSPNGALNFTGLAYLTNFVLPNFYFHISMTYALLRAMGLEIGKKDFLGAIQ
jgi:uncharacterized protein